MENTCKETIGKIRSLMERVEGNFGAFEAQVNEQNRIDEATSKNRVQVSRDEILDILDEMDDEQNETNRGKFVTITYANYAPLLKTKRSIDPEKVNTALGKYQDRSEEDWHKNLSDYMKPDAKGKNPITAVVNVSRYTLKWQTSQNFAKEYNDYRTKLANLRMSHGIGIENDGYLGDNNNQRDKSNTGIQFNQTGRMSRDFNMANTGKPKVKSYFVNNEGEVVCELPEEVVDSIVSQSKPNYGVEAAVAAALSGPALEEYTAAKKEITDNFRPKNFVFDKILCICGAVNGISYYYINDALLTEISKGSATFVNPQDMVEIAKEQLGESFDVIQGFAQ